MKIFNIYKYKSYSHFDEKKHFKFFIKYIQNPKKIERHGFFPFLHYVIRNYKYDNNIKDTKIKPRDINYSSHIDRYIYEYYNYLLNQKYNEYTKERGINKCVVAYRNNLHQNNIHIAKEVFDFIKNSANYFIIIADFTKYFDKINHNYLKSTLSEVLGCEKLPLDWYKVFRSVTKYSSISLDTIKNYKGLSLKKLRKTKRIANISELHELKEFLYINKDGFGIPQGSSISSSLSNVNLIHYDKAINDFVTSKNGFYRRYCDDIIIVIPIELKDELITLFEYQNNITPGLELNKDKIQEFYYRHNTLFDNNSNKVKLKYLGFEFDGKNIRVREKTITNFYLKAYRALNYINYISKKYNRNAYRKQFFLSFSHLGKRKTKENKGNFITYIERCAKAMNDSGIKKQVSRHWIYFNKRLKKYK